MSKRHILWLGLAGLLTFFFVSCSQKDKQDTNSFSGLGSPGDYFPLKVGTTWEYEISVPVDKAVNFREVMWPLGKDNYREIAVRGFFMGQLDKTSRTTFRMSYAIVGQPAKQGMFEYANARQLKVIVDELGVFDDAKEMFWLVSPNGRFEINQVCTFDPNSPGAPTNEWGGWNQAEGNSMRLIFFGASPGTSINVQGSPDQLAFVDADNSVLHFCRTVTGDGSDALSATFTEDTWYAKGKGLIKLVQRVGEHTTMTWVLKRFS